MLVRAESRSKSRGFPRVGYERRVFFLALLAGSPGVAFSLFMLWGPSGAEIRYAWAVTAAVVGIWIFLAAALRKGIVFPLQTISNLVAALREGDFSVRGREGGALTAADTLEELTREVNALAQTLYEQRMGAVEATALLRKVMEEIDVAVFAFDSERRLKLLNRGGERLLHLPAERAVGQMAGQLGLAEYLADNAPRLFDAAFPGAAGRWEIRRSVFRQEGLPHQLLVLSDLTRTLRDEELQAWQRIVRVIGHEINNSLAPIKSISGSLQSQLSRKDRADDWEQDLERGLAIIGSRSEALSRFMTAYARLARLPHPTFKPVEIEALVRRVAGLDTRLAVAVEAGLPATIQADPDQLEQVLINLVRNAVDACLESGGGRVSIRWKLIPSSLELQIADEGPGLSNTSNLFVPFFTTKPGGSGIGLVLSRQIAEAHGGSLRLENDSAGKGCVAYLRLPLPGQG